MALAPNFLCQINITEDDDGTEDDDDFKSQTERFNPKRLSPDRISN